MQWSGNSCESSKMNTKNISDKPNPFLASLIAVVRSKNSNWSVENDLVRGGLSPACAFQLRSPFHNERNHQGKANVILFPAPADRVGEPSGEIRTRERLGGLLKLYHREAA